VNEQLTIRLNSRLVVGLLIALLLIAVIVTNRVFFYLFYTLALLLIFAYYWTRQTASGLILRRETRRDWVQVGDTLRERFTIKNASRWPALWVEMEDHSTVPGYHAGRVESVSGAGGVAWWDAQAVCQRRGLYTLGPATLRTGDPFGLFTATITDSTTRSILVYPAIVDLPGINLPRGTMPGASRSSFRSQEITTNVSSVREYLPGDSLNRIHWLSTAHHSELMVKEFDLEPSGNLWIVLDLHGAVQAGSGDESTEEYGVSLAASLSFKMLEQNKTVGLVAYGERHVILPPDRGRRQLGHILQELAIARATGEFPLAQVIAQVASNLGRGMTITVITPSADPSWAASLMAMTRRGLTPAAIILDASSFGGTHHPQALVSDLTVMGIATFVVRQGQHFTTITRQIPAEERAWRILGTGRVVSVSTSS
jgi:uncharacterized protein (DUF58 family)